MNRTRSILALVKLLNSKRRQAYMPIVKKEPVLSIESVPGLKPKPRPVLKPRLVQKKLSESETKARYFLEQVFLRNGYLRIRVRKKIKANKRLGIYELKGYGKGYEIRLIPKDEEELKEIRSAISELGLTVCNTFIKHNRIVQPLYNKVMTMEFEKLREIYISNNNN